MLFASSSCQCSDNDPGWELYEDVELREDVGPPPADVGFDLPEPVDMFDPPDEWVPEEIVENVPLTHALNERTSLAVDENGTIFLGYHACASQQCDEVYLTIARKARGRGWTYERVKRQEGTFGIDVARPEEVVAAFLDPTDNSFKVARRISPNQYEFRSFAVRRTGRGDGLDIAHDADRMFATFANERGDPVSLFVLSQNQWRGLETLDIGADASAAYERGLAADGQGNLYLIHRGGPFGSPWGLARYSLTEGAWLERTYYDGIVRPRPSSFLIREETGELCIAGDTATELVVTCGDMDDLARNRWSLGETVALGSGGYSSMLEGSDGSLYVAYPVGGNTELRLARKAPNDDIWTFETVFEKNAYGVSTVIDKDDLLVISYYTCGAQNCSLEVISRPQ